jgi:two-component system, NtrC family, response regulator HydG
MPHKGETLLSLTFTASPSSNVTPSRLIGKTIEIQKIRQRIERFAPTQLPILISGETGVGKDYAAQDIHNLSRCSGGPYVEVNCGTLQPSLAASELFGSRRGAFTGAVDRIGLLQQANGGTLFLDEIGDLPLKVQVMLLRTLDGGTFRVLGSQADVRADFRLICASHINLRKACRTRTFRTDLFYRVSSLNIEIPALRARTMDLEDLIEMVCPDTLWRLHPSSLKALRSYAFPGNLRELKNILTSSKALYEGHLIMPHDLRLEKWQGDVETSVTSSLSEQVTRYIHSSFLRHDCNIRQTARALEVSPNTVYRYLAIHEEQTPQNIG